MYATSLTFASTQISVCPALLDHRLELAVDRELHVPLVVRERRIRRHIPVRFAARRGEALQIAGDELEEPASVVDG